MEPQHARRAELWYGAETLEAIFADLEALTRGLLPGELLVLHTNIQDAWEAVPAWCRMHGCEVVWKSGTWEEVWEAAPAYRVTRYRFHIRKAAPHAGPSHVECS